MQDGAEREAEEIFGARSCGQAGRSGQNMGLSKEVQQMAVSVKKAVLWRREVENQPGILATTLKPLAEAGADLQVVMGYRLPGDESKAIIELHPVSNKKSKAAAEAAGLTPSSIATLAVEGDNKPGLGHAIAQAVGDAGINIAFIVAQVVGRKYSAVFGFANESDANRAASLIKKAVPAKKK
jgi:hypothetical protein